MPGLSRREILRLFKLLDRELGSDKTEGELFLVGGAVMCLAYNVRRATRDVDGVFRPTAAIRAAAARVAKSARLDGRWLNDAVKAFLSDKGAFEPFLQLEHLRVMVARADYMLAMKCLAMRIGAEFHDLDDVRYLLRHLDIGSYDEAKDVIGKFYPLDQFPQKTLYALEELFASRGG